MNQWNKRELIYKPTDIWSRLIYTKEAEYTTGENLIPSIDVGKTGQLHTKNETEVLPYTKADIIPYTKNNLKWIKV